MATSSRFTQQSSIYALTFDELQNTLCGSGKDFGSMNMDELLKNIWTSEETQAMTPNSNLGIGSNGNLQKQGSLTLPRTISQKTVDEVWRELVKENGGFKDVNLVKEPNLLPHEKLPTLGEMTLEDFLQKAGVVPENIQTQPNGSLFGDVLGFKNLKQNQGFHQQAVVTNSKNEVDNWQGVGSYSHQSKPQNILPKQAGFNFTSSLNLVTNPKTDRVSIIGKMDHPSDLFPNSNLDTSPSPPSYAYGETGVHERKRGATFEKGVERRRKRMIKNRESAARSRARKQVNFLNIHYSILSCYF